jgi:hypothetical protein
MKITKTLMLAGLTAFSLGVGAAMAQDGGTQGDSYWTEQYFKNHSVTAPITSQSTGTVHSFWSGSDTTRANEVPGLLGGGG